MKMVNQAGGFYKAFSPPTMQPSRIFPSHPQKKGEYVVLRKTIGGKSAGEILADICHQIIASIPFAKSMRWGDHHFFTQGLSAGLLRFWITKLYLFFS